MKNIFKLIIAAFLALATAFSASAGKKVMDHSVYDSWKRVAASTISADGRFVGYEINPQVGDNVLTVSCLADGRKLEIPRGSALQISRDGKWAFCKIKAPYEATRKARIAKKPKDKMPKDSMAVINLSDFSIVKINNCSSWKTTVDGNVNYAYETEVTAKADTASKKKPGKEKVLIAVNPDTGRQDTLRHVGSYLFDKYGGHLAVVFKKDKKDSLSRDEVAIYRIGEMQKHTLSEGKKYYASLRFNRNGDKMLFLASTDSAKTGGKHCSVFLAEDKVTGRGRKAVRSISVAEIVPQGYTEGLPEGMTVTEHSNPLFSVKNDRVFLGVAPVTPQKDTSIIDFEAARLDIWNWDTHMLPPQQNLVVNRIKSATCRAVVHLDNPGKVIPICTDIEEESSLVCGGEADWALVYDDTPYVIDRCWNENRLVDVYKVDLKTGGRELLFKANNGRPGVSPAGKYLTWYDDSVRCWFSWNVATREKVNLTGGLDGIFFNDEDDHPMPKPQLGGPRWMENDEAFLMSEKYDVWKITPDGRKAENMTCGEGRRTNRQFRVIGIVPQDITGDERAVGYSIPVGRKETLHLSVFDRTTKENGYATMSAAKAGIISSFTVPKSFSELRHAFNAPVVAFQKGDFNNPMDLYVTRDYWATEERLTDLGWQLEEYNWGNVQLVHWNAYDGTPLDGLLFTPEDLDPSKKYPMICYFYEKNSQTRFSFYNPAPSRSVINYPFYTSRGYVVFVPDIVYKDGHPGESAFNCICSGAEAMCRQFSYIDRSRMGIQGQSWGGYQTAYLATRTDMFAAAGAGAPVSNMISAYSGIRWGSGISRAMQYEKGQSRIGCSFWDEGGMDLYVENSPVFHVKKCTTPVLIMANDKDGAVPWYQGIEFFLGLRRFGKPAWLLQYNNEQHNLVERRNCIDLSKRLQQFFDHYLKGEPMPAWMKNGIIATRKGEYYGFEPAE